jgi:hypothetical protein
MTSRQKHEPLTLGFMSRIRREAGHCNISYLQIPASVRSDEYLSTFVLNFINIFSISSGYGQTEY